MKKENVTEIVNDLKKFSKKCNAMMLSTTEGKAPQLLKMVMLQTLVEEYFLYSRKVIPKEQIIEAENIIKDFIRNFGKLRLLGKDELKEMME